MTGAVFQDWIVFAALVAFLLVLDIAVASRGQQSLQPGEKWKWCYLDKTMVD